MTRRDVILACTAGLAAALFSGCMRAAVDARPAATMKITPIAASARPNVVDPGSPSDARSVNQPGPKKDSVERVHHEGTPPFAPLPEKTNPPSEPLPAPTDPLPKLAQNPKPEPAEEPLLVALRCLLNKHPAEAVKWLERYDKANQELLLCLLPLAARLTEGKLDQANPQYLSTVLDQLNSLSRPLRSRAALTIDKTCFCREIKGYGLYEPLPDDHVFRPGSETRLGEMVQVYVEVRNFASEAQGAYHVTRLASSLQICDFKGKPVWRHEFPDASLRERDWGDRSRSPRTDYFINFNFRMPPLAPGYYTLRVQVEDVLTKPHRMDQRALDFKVSGGTSERRPLDETGGNK